MRYTLQKEMMLPPYTFPNWQSALANAITDSKTLLTALNLTPSQLTTNDQACLDFPLRVPWGFVARMQTENPDDPLLRQVLPVSEELILTPGYSHDPLQEQQANPIAGLLHKYHGRVLLTLTGACAIHCRYCFRRHFPYASNNPGTQGWQQTLTYISQDCTISEVLLSGGDPLLIKDEQLILFITQLAKIKHVKRLRIHSRLPIVLPERITDNLVNCLVNSRLQPIMVIHCNHPNEIDIQVTTAIKKLKTAGITVFNQSVLLKKINDNATVLIKLSEALFEIGVIPYYLHLLDKVQGAAHFNVTKSTARHIYTEMVHKLPGYLVPKLVREESGKLAKSNVIIST